MGFEDVADEKPGYKPGDLNFVVVEKDHPEYHREGDHLYKTMSISLVDALTGFSLTLKQLEGEEVLRIPGKGMPRRSGRDFGDLFITFEVDFPEALNPSQKEKLREVLGVDTESDRSGHSEL